MKWSNIKHWKTATTIHHRHLNNNVAQRTWLSVNCEHCRNKKRSGEQWRRVRGKWRWFEICVCVNVWRTHKNASTILQFGQHIFSKKGNPRFLRCCNIKSYVIQPLMNTNIKVFMSMICFVPIIILRYIPLHSEVWFEIWNAWPARNGDTDGPSWK